MTSTKQYDFVVVGGGTAGLCVAARLAEDGTKSVLVLEAGSNETSNPSTIIPALWNSMVGTDLDWKFKTTPQAGLKDRSVRQAQGRMIGGSSSINGQTYAVPSKRDLDAWEKLGNKGWNWDSLLPYYQKSTKYHPLQNDEQKQLGIDKWFDPKNYGKDGPIQLEPTAAPGDLVCKAWVDTVANLGFSHMSDVWSGRATGGHIPLATRDPKTKTRSSAATGYLPAVQHLTNFELVPNATVLKIEFESESVEKRARSVHVQREGVIEEIVIGQELILSAGAYNSPKLLELSGVGNRQILEKHGIDVVIDNPGVGEGLQDHLNTGIGYEATEGVETLDGFVRQDANAIQAGMARYQNEQAGPFATGGVPTLGYLPLDGEDFTEQQKLLDEYEAQVEAKDSHHFKTLRDIISNPEEASGGHYMFPVQVDVHYYGQGGNSTPNILEGNYLTLGIIHVHPFSRGSTHIKSASPEEDPEIDPKYFSNKLDLEIMARHLLRLEKVAKTAPFSNYLKPNGRRNHSTAYIESLEDAKQYLLSTALSIWHPVGTCAMLLREHGGVVNERLQVYSTSNVRVVDTSIIPLLPRANPVSTAYAIAERAADIIKGAA